jgi:hypothetical protein
VAGIDAAQLVAMMMVIAVDVVMIVPPLAKASRFCSVRVRQSIQRATLIIKTADAT